MALLVALGPRDLLEIVEWMAVMDSLEHQERRAPQVTLGSLDQLDCL